MVNTDTKGAVWRPSPNYEARTAPAQFIILHGTWMADDAEALTRLCDPAAKVSCHYMINADGTLHQLVRENQIAWHAGISAWGPHKRLNGTSIGIEISNPGDGTPYTERQYHVLEGLMASIMTRTGITADHVLAHSDIATDRKDDPGAWFNWQRLEQKGLAAPWQPNLTIDDPVAALRAHGYHGTDDNIVIAFQRHYMRGHVSGILCPQTKALILTGKNA